MLIWLSDTTGISLLVTTIAIQVAFFVALIFVLWLIALYHPDPAMLLFLVVTPAFAVFFWAANPQGSMRKEVIGFLALALLAFGSLLGGRRPGLAWIALALFVLGCLGNILHALMAGVFLTAYWLARDGGQIGATMYRYLAGLTLLVAAFWFGFAVTFAAVPELAGICGKLLDRGLQEPVCQDALRWLVTGEVDHLGEVRQKMTPVKLGHFAIAALLALVPVLSTFVAFRERALLAWLVLAAFAPMLPLYVIATDWGRWLSISYTSYVLLVIQAEAVGRLSLHRLPPWFLIAPPLLAALFLAPEHTVEWQFGGAVRSVLSMVADFF